MKQRLQGAVSLLCVLAMCIGLLPSAALAADSQTTGTGTEPTTTADSTPTDEQTNTGNTETPKGSTPDTTEDTSCVARIANKTEAEGEYTYYETLDEAVEGAVDGTTIELLADCKLTKAFDKSLTFTGNGKITCNTDLPLADNWWVYGDHTLTFDGSGVTFEWDSRQWDKPEQNKDRWLMMSLSGTIHVTNGATCTFRVDSKSGQDVWVDQNGKTHQTYSNCAIYMNSGSELIVDNGSTFQILGYNTQGVVGQAIQLDSPACANITVSDKSTFLIDGTNRGYVNSPNIYVKDSTFTIQNCTANASNGGKFEAVNSTVVYKNNAGHGLSADSVILKNSTLTADNNGYYGVYSSGGFFVDSTSTLTVTRNSRSDDCAGLKLTSGVTDGKVENGAVVTITDNYCSGLSNNGNVVFEEGVKLTITGNINDKGTTSNGGGIYNSGASANLTLPSDAIIYNNHTKTAGDDIFNNTTSTITFGQVGSDWRLDGKHTIGDWVISDCTDLIDGWYDDSANNRWEAHSVGETQHVEKHTGFTDSLVTVTGLTALKAAHGLGTLTVSKFVAPNNSITQKFAITVSITDEDNKTGTKHLYLSDSESDAVYIPYGASYVVSEENYDGYNDPVIVGETGTITEANQNQIASVINIPAGSNALVISKTVEGESASDDAGFSFTLTLPAGEFEYIITTVEGATTATGTVGNGGTITLRSGESAVICGLPVGSGYTVTEAETEGYTTTVTAANGMVTTSNTVSGTIPVAGTVPVVHYTNTYIGETMPEGVITIAPADMTIYTGGEVYGGVADADGNFIATASGLPEPGYHLELSDDVVEWLQEKTDSLGAADLSKYLTFTYSYGDVTRTWKLTYMGVYDINRATNEPTRYVYSLSPTDPTNPKVRIVYTDAAGAEYFTDDIDMSENAVSAKYTMSIYPGDLQQELIQAVLTVGDHSITANVEIETGTLTIRSTTDAENVNGIADNANGVDRNNITAVGNNNVTYYVNDSQVEVDASRVALLVDEVSNNSGYNASMAQDAIYHAITSNTTNWSYRSSLSYEMAYMDLVDTRNGHTVVTMGENDYLTIYWPMPAGADPSGDFHVVHYYAMDRETIVGENELDSAAKEILTGEAVRINGQWYVAFATDSFSPFVLVYETENPYAPPIGPSRPGTDDEDDENDGPGDLNTEDHVAYLIGFTDGTIRPEAEITRAEVATIFFRLLTDEARNQYWSQTNPYPDVDSEAWYNNAISTLTNMGILTGYDNGSFGPTDPITRAEFTTIAVRFFKSAYDYVYTGGYSDVLGTEWYARYIAAATELGLVEGMPDGTFRPLANISRAEAATIVSRTLGRVPHEDHLLPWNEMIVWPDNSSTQAWYYEAMQEATNSHDYTWTEEGKETVEQWTEKLAERDWAALEREWSNANSAPGGEIMR